MNCMMPTRYFAGIVGLPFTNHISTPDLTGVKYCGIIRPPSDIPENIGVGCDNMAGRNALGYHETGSKD